MIFVDEGTEVRISMSNMSGGQNDGKWYDKGDSGELHTPELKNMSSTDTEIYSDR